MTSNKKSRSEQFINFDENIGVGVQGLVSQIQDSIISPIHQTISKIKIVKVSNGNKKLDQGIQNEQDIAVSDDEEQEQSFNPVEEERPADRDLEHRNTPSVISPPSLDPSILPETLPNPEHSDPVLPDDTHTIDPDIGLENKPSFYLPPPPEFPEIPEDLLIYNQKDNGIDLSLLQGKRKTGIGERELWESVHNEGTHQHSPSRIMQGETEHSDKLTNLADKENNMTNSGGVLTHGSIGSIEPDSINGDFEQNSAFDRSNQIIHEPTSMNPVQHIQNQANSFSLNIGQERHNVPVSSLINTRTEMQYMTQIRAEDEDSVSVNPLEQRSQHGNQGSWKEVQDVNNPLLNPPNETIQIQGEEHLIEDDRSPSPSALRNAQPSEGEQMRTDFLNPLSPQGMEEEISSDYQLREDLKLSIREYLSQQHDVLNMNLEKLFSGHNIIEGEIANGGLYLSLSFQNWVSYGQKLAQNFPYDTEIRISYVINCLNSAFKMNIESLNKVFIEGFDATHLKNYEEVINNTLVTINEQLDIAKQNIINDERDTYKTTYFLSQAAEFSNALKSYNEVLKEIIQKYEENILIIDDQHQSPGTEHSVSEEEVPPRESDEENIFGNLPGRVSIQEGLTEIYESEYTALVRSANDMYQLHTELSHRVYDLLEMIHNESQKSFSGLNEDQTHKSLQALKDNFAFLTNEIRVKSPVVTFLKNQLNKFFEEHQVNEEGEGVLLAIEASDEEISESYDSLSFYAQEIDQANDILSILPD